MTRIWLLFGVSVLIFSACVPAKKLVYLQKDDELQKRKSIPKDSILRTHDLQINEYKIQPLDILSINFETLNDESDSFDFLKNLNPTNRTSGGGSGGAGGGGSVLNGILVNTQGEVEYAVLGKIKVGGLTIFEAQDLIKSIASQYLPDVVVRVRMLNFRFTVLGEVNNERTVSSSNTRLTIAEAIGLSGGLGELADRSTVKVIRQNANRVDVYYIDLLKEDFTESPFYYVQQNDVIIVPPLKQRTFRKYWIGNLAIVTATLSFTAIIISLFR